MTESTISAAPPRPRPAAVPPVDDLLARVESALGTGADAGTFQAHLVREAAAACGWRAATLWRVDGEGPAALCRFGKPGPAEDAGQAAADLDAGHATVVPQDGETPPRRLSAAAVAGDVRVVLDAATPAASDPRLCDFTAELTEILADLERRRTLRNLLAGESKYSAVLTLVSRMHGSLVEPRVCNVFATEAPPVLEIDRAAVLSRRGRSWRLRAVTGVADPDPRSDAAAAFVTRVRDAVRGTDDPSGERLVLPVPPDADWKAARAAVVLERAAAEDAPPLTPTPFLKTAVRELDAALANCRDADSRGFVRTLGRGAGRLLRPSALLALLLLAGAAAYLWFGTATLRVRALGEARPAIRKTLFAAEDGVVREVRVRDGQAVAAGDVLFVLSNEDFALARETLSGELAEAESRLAAVGTMRGVRDPAEVARISAEKAELEVRVDSLRKRLELLAGREASLTVRSPIGGTVSRDGDLDSLVGRPLTRSQYLLDVADTVGPWEATLRIPGDEVRHVLAAGEDAAVEYVFETRPDAVHEAALASLEPDGRLGPDGGVVFEATLAVSPGQVEGLPQGAGVVASVDCGERRAGAVWLRGVIEFVQRRLWFW